MIDHVIVFKAENISPETERTLMDRLGVPVNTLRMRALRLREKLQSCVEECVSGA